MRQSDVKIYGQNACRALYAMRPADVRRAFVNETMLAVAGDMLRELARTRRPYRVVDEAELAKVSGSEHHEGICLYAAPRTMPSADELFEPIVTRDVPARVLFLDGVDNPHNVGAIVRSAAHFGAVAVAGAQRGLPEPAGAMARVAEGGAEHVAILRWEDPIGELRRMKSGFELVAASQEAKDDLFDAPLAKRSVILLGAERDGLSRDVRSLATRTVRIPGTGRVESLNVAAAAAIMLGEHARRFGVSGP